MLYDWTPDRAYHFVTGMVAMGVILFPIVVDWILSPRGLR